MTLATEKPMSVAAAIRRMREYPGGSYVRCPFCGCKSSKHAADCAIEIVAAAVALRWRPDTEKPLETEPTSCVLAFHDRDGDDPNDAALAGIYLWRHGEFVSEEDDSHPRAPFFWLYERELTSSVPQPETSNAR